jgi:hypothetical protein
MARMPGGPSPAAQLPEAINGVGFLINLVFPSTGCHHTAAIRRGLASSFDA